MPVIAGCGGRWRRATVLLGLAFASCTGTTRPAEDTVFQDRMHRSTEPTSGLEGRLQLVLGPDGGVREVVVELHNPSPDHDVLIRVNAETSAFIMLAVSARHRR